MQHSINYIADKYSEISNLRNDSKRFDKKGFIDFAKENKEKYSLIENSLDLLVSSWYSGDLIKDYRETL